MEQFNICFKWDNVCKGIWCSEIKWGYSISVPVPFPSLQAIWEVSPRQGIMSMVGGKCVLIPSKLNFMVGEKFKTSESFGHKETLCGLSTVTLALSGIVLGSSSWQLTAQHFSSWPEASSAYSSTWQTCCFLCVLANQNMPLMEDIGQSVLAPRSYPLS